MSAFGVNPYAQGGWANPHNNYGEGSEGGPIPSIHGALPYIPSVLSGRSEQLITFRFQPHPPTNSILDCVVVGSDSRPRFYVSTGAAQDATPAVTTLKDEGGNLAATIEWQYHPVVQLKTYSNTIPRQFSSQLLPLSSNQSSRTMSLGGKSYQWSRDPERDCIYLHNISYSPRELLGFLSRGPDSAVQLSILPVAVSQGLLDVAALVSILFYSNRNID